MQTAFEKATTLALNGEGLPEMPEDNGAPMVTAAEAAEAFRTVRVRQSAGIKANTRAVNGAAHKFARFAAYDTPSLSSAQLKNVLCELEKAIKEATPQARRMDINNTLFTGVAFLFGLFARLPKWCS